MNLTKKSELEHGMSVRCIIDGSNHDYTTIEDAKISITGVKYYICHDNDDYNGISCYNKLGYYQSWIIGFNDDGTIDFKGTSLDLLKSLNETTKTINKKGEIEMNKQIIKLYPNNTQGAVLVDKYFGYKFKDPVFSLLISGKKDKLLDLAKELEEESKKE